MKLILVLLVAIAVVTQAFRVTNNGKFYLFDKKLIESLSNTRYVRHST